MDPITAAIVAAIAAGMSEVGKQAVVDTYSALKNAIKGKYGTDSNVAQAITNLEKEPDFEPNQNALTGRIAQVKAAENPELQELAQALLKALESTPEGKKAVSKYHIVDSKVGIAGDHANVKDGIHFG